LRDIAEKIPMAATNATTMIMKGRYRFIGYELWMLASESRSFVFTKV
jgi:hypothetical protein